MIAVLAKVFGIDVVEVKAVTPPPPTGTSWAYVNQTGASSGNEIANLRLNYSSTHWDFHNRYAGKTLNVYDNPWGPADSWDLWQADGMMNNPSIPNMYILSNNSVTPNSLENVCWDQKDPNLGQVAGAKDFFTGVFGDWNAISIPSVGVKLWCYKAYEVGSINQTPGALFSTRSTFTNTQPTVAAWQTAAVDYNIVLQKARESISKPIMPTILPVQRIGPISANDQACKSWYTTRRIASDADAQKWIDAQLKEIKTVVPDGQNDAAAQYLKDYLSNSASASALKSFLINTDAASFQRYYGTASKQYPTVALSTREANSLVSDWDKLNAGIPYVINGQSGAVTASNWFLGVGAVALIAAGVVTAMGVGGTVLFGSAGVTAPAVAVTQAASGAAVTASGIEISGAYGTALLHAATAAGTGTVVDGGILLTTGAVIPATATEIAAGSVVATTAAKIAIGAVVTLTAVWLHEYILRAAALAVGVIIGVYNTFKTWMDAAAKAGTWNPIVAWLNNSEYKAAREAYLYNISKFSLDMYYANQNNQYNNCLKGKGDPAAVFNSTVDSQYQKLLPQGYALAGTFNNAPGASDSPSLCAGFDMWKEPISWAFCGIISIFYDFATWLQGLGDKWMAATIGVTYDSCSAGP
jgi:hypothetical protein